MWGGHSNVLQLNTTRALDSSDALAMPQIFLEKAIYEQRPPPPLGWVGWLRVPEQHKYSQEQGSGDMWHGTYL